MRVKEVKNEKKKRKLNKKKRDETRHDHAGFRKSPAVKVSQHHQQAEGFERAYNFKKGLTKAIKLTQNVGPGLSASPESRGFHESVPTTTS